MVFTSWGIARISRDRYDFHGHLVIYDPWLPASAAAAAVACVGYYLSNIQIE